jgi:hypothetical protein
VLVLLLGCTHWEPFPTPTPDAEAPHLPTSLRVWTSDHQGTELSWPLVRADTLYGRSRGGAALRIDEPSPGNCPF